MMKAMCTKSIFCVKKKRKQETNVYLPIFAERTTGRIKQRKLKLREGEQGGGSPGVNGISPSRPLT